LLSSGFIQVGRKGTIPRCPNGSFSDRPSSGVIHIIVSDPEDTLYSAFPLCIADFLSAMERVEDMGDLIESLGN